jgi:poly(U)-specific endoribonuclease
MLENNIIVKLNKKMFKYLFKIYKKKKKEKRKDKFNYNIIKELKEIKKYINDLLTLNNIHKDYFYGAKYFNINDCNNINILVDKLNIYDVNRFINIQDYKVHIQNPIELYSNKDVSPYPLFSYVNERKFKLGTYKYFLRLYPLFTKQLGITEEYSKYKENIIKKFIKKLCKTKVFIYLFFILKEKGKIKHFCNFPKFIYKFWFKSISKMNKNDSCLFEHLFLGELDTNNSNNLYGYHNWILFYNDEKIGKVNYYGYHNIINNIISIKFSFEANIKHACSFFIGTSIEFEMALYTLIAFFTNENKIKLLYYNKHITFNIIKKNNRIISIYPVLGFFS